MKAMVHETDNDQCDEEEARRIGHLPQWHDYMKVRELLESYSPYRFFMTLSFQYELSDREGQEALGKAWRRCMKKVLGKRWISKGVKPLTGVAVMEKAQIFDKSSLEFGSCHFHMLIHDHHRLPKDDLFAGILLFLAFADAANQLTHKNRRHQLVSKHGVHLKIIGPRQSRSFCKYVAKEARQTGWRWDERVFYLGKDGI